MISKPSRRTILAGAAATVPALAMSAFVVPTVALAATMPDPTFAAIELHRKIEKDLNVIGDKIAEVEDGASRPNRRPIALVTWRNWMIGGSEIDDRREAFLREPKVNRVMIEREYREKKAEYRAVQKAGRDWDKKHGIDGLRDRWYTGLAERDTAGEALGLAKPITVAGAAALVAYARADLEIGPDNEWPLLALGNAVAALEQLDTATVALAI